MIASGGGTTGGGFPPSTLSFPSPSANNNNNSNSKDDEASTASTACLRATILTAYDLPLRDPPSKIRLTVGNHSVTTGPPIQRHKDRNSFRFHSSSTSSQQQQGGTTRSSSSNLVIRCNKLEELYQETAVLTVEYPQEAQAPTRTLTAKYELSQLKINEVTWLILSLDDGGDDDDSTDEGSFSNNNAIDEEEEEQDQGNTAPEFTSAALLSPRGKVKSSKRGGSVSSGRPLNDSYSIGWEGDNEDDLHPPPPTLRLQFTLEGPYRPEISAVMNVFHGWLSFANRCEDTIQGLFDRIITNHFAWWDSKLLLVPAVPLFAAGVVSTPLLVGLCVTFLPMLLPLAVLLSILLLGIVIIVAILYASTRKGREYVGSLFQPLLRSTLATNVGQRMVYETGPRPTPVALCRTFLVPHDMWGKLLISLTLDGFGSASFLVPILGEVTDVVFYAHFQTLLVMAMYDDIAPNLKYISFFEEFLPFTDLMPSATLGWLKEYGWIPLMQMILHHDKVVATTTSIQRRKRRAQDRLGLLAQQGAQALTRTSTATKTTTTTTANSPSTTTTPLTTNTTTAKR